MLTRAGGAERLPPWGVPTWGRNACHLQPANPRPPPLPPQALQLCRVLALARVVQMLLLLRHGWRGYSRHRVAVNLSARLLFCLVLHPALIRVTVRSPSFLPAAWLQPAGGGAITSSSAVVKALLMPTGELLLSSCCAGAAPRPRLRASRVWGAAAPCRPRAS